MRASRPSVATSSTTPLTVFVSWKAAMPRPSRKQRVRRMLPPCVTSSALRPSRATSRSAAQHAPLLVDEALAAREAEALGMLAVVLPGLGLLEHDLGEEARLPLAAVRLRESRVEDQRHVPPSSARDDLGGLSGARQVAGDDELDAAAGEGAALLARLGAAGLVEVDLAPSPGSARARGSSRSRRGGGEGCSRAS